MLSTVFTKTTRDRLPSGMFGAVLVGAFLFFGMWVYGDIDTSFYYDLPEAILEPMGINPDGEGAGGIAFGAIYNLIGAFTVSGLAIGMGAAAVAGEEQQGTFDLLLGNPVSRRGVILSKSLSMVFVVTLTIVVIHVAGIASASVLGISTEGLFVGAIALAMYLNGLFYGFLALTLGAWTGNRGVASGGSAGVMIVGYLAASLLPLVDMEWLAQVFPWYYYSAGSPLQNGLDGSHVTILASLSILCFVIAYVGIERRDLKQRGAHVTIPDRLRAHPMTRMVVERIAGSARVSRISAKTISEYQSLFTVTAAVMFWMGLLIPPLYKLMPADFINIFAAFPDALVAMVGGVDMSTPTGFLTGETFSLVGPIAVIVLAATIGGRAVAGEEEKNTMDLLLSNPISRSRVVIEKVQAMITYTVLLGVVTFGGTWLGVLVGGLDDVAVAGIAAISLQLVLLGLAFGGVALLISSATGMQDRATMTAAATAAVTWFTFAFFPLSENFQPWARLSPFDWYLGSDPLLNGVDWTDAGLLFAMFVLLVALSIPFFQRRDLRG